MRHAARCAAVVVVVAGLCRPSAGQEASADQEIRNREEALASAMHARNRSALEGLLAPGYVLRGAPDIDRATWIRNAVSLCWGDHSDIDGFDVREVDGAAVASFQLTFSVDPSTCKPATLRSLITDVWRRSPGGWQLQVRHSGPVPAGGVAAQFGAVPTPPPALELSSDLSFVSTGGNTSTRTLGVGASAIHRRGAGETRASLAFLTNEADGVTKARSTTIKARHGRRVGSRTQVFGEGSYARDRFAGISHRWTASAGAAYAAALPARHTLSAEGSAGFTSEQRLEENDLNFATATGTVRYAWTPRPGAQFRQDTSLVADLQSAGNWRGTSATALVVTLTRLLSLKMSHSLEYRHAPVPGFRRLDTQTSAALLISFQRPAR